MEKVYLSKCDDYSFVKIKTIFCEQFRELKLCKKIKPGMTVVIKPNLVMKSDPESGIITHPVVVAAVGSLVKEMGARVLIAESSGGVFTPSSVKSVMNGCGYTEIAEKYGFEIYTECKANSVDINNAEICRTMTVLEPYINADFIINIGKLKSHCMTRFSGAVKNLFGTVPGLMKPELHFRFPKEEDFCTMLVDLCEFIKPNLSIIDAVDAMEGDGPTGGTKRHIGAFVIAENPYAADMVSASIANMEPKSVCYLKNAMSRGVCPKSIKDIAVMGEKLEDFIQEDFKQPRSKGVDFSAKVPKFLRPITIKITTPKPVIRTKKCIGCGKCAESCPRHTIKIVDRKAIIEYNKCIKCFCCHEMCPKHIINVRRFSLFNL